MKKHVFIGLVISSERRLHCEILDSTMIMKDGNIYWCDCGNLSESDLDDYTGTLICASGMRWRSIENHMGENEFYHSTV